MKISKKETTEQPYSSFKGGFSIFVGGNSCVEGHFNYNSDSTQDEIGYQVIEIVTEICKEHNVSIKDTMLQIEYNLKLNCNKKNNHTIFTIPTTGISREKVEESLAKLMNNYKEDIDWNNDVVNWSGMI